MTIAFTLPLVPVAWERVDRNRYGFAYVPAKTKRFENAVASYAMRYAPATPLRGPLTMTIRFIVKRPRRPEFHLPAVRPDLSNYIKAVEDGLNKVIWDDDARLCHIDARKLYDMTGAGPRIEIEISTIEEPLCQTEPPPARSVENPASQNAASAQTAKSRRAGSAGLSSGLADTPETTTASVPGAGQTVDSSEFGGSEGGHG